MNRWRMNARAANSCALFQSQRAGPSHTAAAHDGGMFGDTLGDLGRQASVLGSEVEPRSNGSCQLNPVTHLGPFTRRSVDDALRGAPLGGGDGVGSCSIDRRAWGENTELAAMGTVTAARSPQRPIDPAGLHPTSDEVVTGGEELPALGQFDVAVLRAPQPVLGVVHVEVQAVEIAVGHDPSVVDRRDRDAHATVESDLPHGASGSSATMPICALPELFSVVLRFRDYVLTHTGTWRAATPTRLLWPGCVCSSADHTSKP